MLRTTVKRYGFISSVAFVLLLTAWIFFWNLGASSISQRSDEVIYARIAQSVIHNGDIFPLAHGSAPTYEKPPLKLWCSALVLALFGESNLTFRVLDGALGVVAVALTIWLAKMVSGSAVVAVLSGLALLAMPELVISHHGFRRAVLDGLLTVFTLLAAIYTWRAAQSAKVNRDKRRLYAIKIGAICSLAVLTKSVAGFFPALCAAVFLVINDLINSKRLGAPRYAERRSGDFSAQSLKAAGQAAQTVADDSIKANCLVWVWILALPLIAFLGYAGLLGVVAGLKALEVFLGVEIYTRVFSGFDGHNVGHAGFYWWYLFERGAATPRALLLFGSIGAIVAALRGPNFIFLLVWGYLPVVLYSLAASRVPWYINPFLPFLSVISVAGSAYLARAISHKFRAPKLALGVWVGVVLVLSVVSLPPFYRALLRNIKTVASDQERIEIDRFVERYRDSYQSFAIIEDSLSGRSNPRRGRFNVEGIYREMLRAKLRPVKDISQFKPQSGELVLVREDSLSELPAGWREVQRIAPFFARPWSLVAVEYYSDVQKSVPVKLARLLL
jgi:4-amino-4-deoxy-L-arabinose transferase-like glycosyltransferase